MRDGAKKKNFRDFIGKSKYTHVNNHHKVQIMQQRKILLLDAFMKPSPRWKRTVACK